jgi:aerobic-type carbon monoxide dehydrogenase small subunit (CoxS/CutS family)
LLSVLRDDLALTGTKYGCGEGRCGACTVLIDGKARRSCQTEVGECSGKEITTIEGLARDGQLHPLQAAFLEVGAMQCGYCTPGMIVAGTALLAKNADPTPKEISRALNGNICRCGTYSRIVEAVRRAGAAIKAGAQP